MHRLLITLIALFLGTVPLTALAQEAGPQYLRPYDQSGMNVFETPKADDTPFTGLRVDWGAAFTQQFQALSHSSEAAPVLDEDGNNLNTLYDLGNGFNLATANLYLDAQLAEGIRVNLITYLSARHHAEAWVKGGYLQVDELAMLNSDLVDRVMDYVTVKVGHFEINYGDAHFRRSDNGNALYNPFVGNLILDAFTTEIGGEVYAQHGGALAMVGVTGGEIKGDIKGPVEDRAPSFYGKLGVDRQVTDDLRLRLTGSAYTTTASHNNTLYAGDRAGSRYYLVMEDADASAGSDFRSGLINPGLRDRVTAFQLNPFVKVHGLELFGVVERAEGRAHNETEDRVWNQYAVDAIFRFLPQEQLFVGARYNTASGQLQGMAEDVTVNRWALGAGWFVTPNVLAKVEYVNQTYSDFPTDDLCYEGEFNGFMIEGVVAF
ncbi:MAG: hypothetical protein R3362_01860 [Rhodothermales bacterium]|nr:hypothetical protein [Rhodothermales bacterium]